MKAIDRLCEKVRKDGYAAGKAQALYAVEHNLVDAEPPNLSGEWADDPTPNSLARLHGITDADEIDALCDSWEEGVEEAWTEYFTLAAEGPSCGSCD